MTDREKLMNLVDFMTNKSYSTLVVKSMADYLLDNGVVILKKGKWMLEREPDGKPYCFHCSVCDGDFHYIGIKTAFPYCPNCGARMEEYGSNGD